MCGKQFEGNSSDEDVETELKASFGNHIRKEECVVVCDGCYKKCNPSSSLGLFEKYLTADLKRNML